MAAQYDLDGSHSEIGFSVKHLMLSNVKGRFNKFDGTFQYDEKTKTLSGLTAKIDVSSVDTNDKKRDEHLTSPDFFDAKKSQYMEFKADKVAGVEVGKTIKVPGVLTMRGVAKPVTLDVNFAGITQDFQKTEKVVFTATAKINRKDWGMSWNKSLDKGGVAVGEDVAITIEAEANKKK